MKKTLLILTASAIASVSFGQLTQANEPAIGASSTMFLCDSNLTNLSSVTGTGVMWDYSGMAIYNGETRLVGIDDATTSPNASDFPNCTKVFSIENLVSTFYYSSATERTSEGFIYTDSGSGSDYLVKWTTDPEIMLTYPFAQGNTSTDTYTGTVNALAQDFPATGTVNATVDGTGMLMLPNGVNISNVIRLKTSDIASATTPFGTANITREQYEYYDYATGNLPVFIHTKIHLLLAGVLDQTSQLVLSKFGSNSYVGINENAISNLSIYPNPATSEFKVEGNFATGKVTIYSAQGQEVLSKEIASGQTVEISDLTSGLYIVKVEANGATTVKHLSVK